MRVIVTGGAGFIGSNIVDALLERGDEVTVLDDLSTGRASNLDGAIARGAKLRRARHPQRRRPRRRLRATRAPEAVLHLAAQIDVRKSIADAGVGRGDQRRAGRSTCSRRRATHGVRRVVNSSTGGAIYGDAETIPTARGRDAAAGGGLRPEQARPPRATSASTSASTA